MMLTQTVKSTVVAFIGQNQCIKKNKRKKIKSIRNKQKRFNEQARVQQNRTDLS